MVDRGYKDESSARERLRTELRELAHRTPNSGYIHGVQQYGVEKSLDLDQVSEALTSLNDIDLRRYQGDDIAKDLLRQALAATHAALQHLYEKYWAANGS